MFGGYRLGIDQGKAGFGFCSPCHLRTEVLAPGQLGLPPMEPNANGSRLQVPVAGDTALPKGFWLNGVSQVTACSQIKGYKT